MIRPSGSAFQTRQPVGSSGRVIAVVSRRHTKTPRQWDAAAVSMGCRPAWERTVDRCVVAACCGIDMATPRRNECQFGRLLPLDGPVVGLLAIGKTGRRPPIPEKALYVAKNTIIIVSVSRPGKHTSPRAPFVGSRCRSLFVADRVFGPVEWYAYPCHTRYSVAASMWSPPAGPS